MQGSYENVMLKGISVLCMLQVYEQRNVMLFPNERTSENPFEVKSNCLLLNSIDVKFAKNVIKPKVKK